MWMAYVWKQAIAGWGMQEVYGVGKQVVAAYRGWHMGLNARSYHQG